MSTTYSKPIRASRRVAAVAILSPIALILTQGPRIPFPLLPFLTLELWEAPVYFALFYLDIKSALTVELVVYLAVQVLAPGVIPFGPVYNLVAVVSTIAGAYLGLRTVPGGYKVKTAAAVGAGSLIRLLVMTVFNSVFLPMSYPFGFNVPISKIEPGIGAPVILGLIGIFNVVVAVYSMAIALVLVRLSGKAAGRGRR